MLLSNKSLVWKTAAKREILHLTLIDFYYWLLARLLNISSLFFCLFDFYFLFILLSSFIWSCFFYIIYYILGINLCSIALLNSTFWIFNFLIIDYLNCLLLHYNYYQIRLRFISSMISGFLMEIIFNSF